MKDLINLALQRMGYRQPDISLNEKWAKPWSFTIVVVEVTSDDTFTISQWMMGTPSKPKLMVWSSDNIKLDPDVALEDIVNKIAYWEEYSTKEYAPPILHRFDFLTKTEAITSFCGL